MRKILITGAAGFIGSNLAIRLLDLGYAVVGYDNLSQGTLENLRPVIRHPKFNFVQADILDKPTLLKASAGVDAIMHLAAYKIPRYSDALDTLRINGFGSDNVAEVAVKVKAHLIAASTSDIYGKNPNLPFAETSNSVIGSPEVKRWAYAISKMFEEQLLFAYRDKYDVSVTLVRFFGGYGPNQHLSWWGGPQSVFIKQALAGESIEIHGDGLQTRTFTYVSDHVDGLVKILEVEKSKNEVFNLGAFEEISILALAKKIWKLVNDNEDALINLVPYSNFGKYEDVMRRVPDITKAAKMLEYQPMISLDEGLKKTIVWQRERQKINQTLEVESL